jgi:hypothetical protein
LYGFYNENFKGPLLILFGDFQKVFCHSHQNAQFNVEFNSAASSVLLKANKTDLKIEISVTRINS